MKWSGAPSNDRWYSPLNPGSQTIESVIMEMDERLVNLEIKLASQDDLLDTLNQTIYRQQKKIDELDALCAALARRITELPAQASGSLPHDKPPHY
jgi:SlyX protein